MFDLTRVQRCAFVNFTDRDSAEKAAQAWANGFEVDGEAVNVKWGRSRAAAKGKTVGAAATDIVS